MQVSLWNNRASLFLQQSGQIYLKTIVPYHSKAIVSVSLWNNSSSLTWEQLWLSHLGTFESVSLGNKATCVISQLETDMDEKLLL